MRKWGFRGDLKKGLVKGIQFNKLDTAKKMLGLGFSIKDIIAVTGLSAEEIDKIKL